MAIEPEYLALFNGYMNDKVDADMDRRSPMTYCAQGMSIQADALFIQGFKDTLFPLNQGLNNRACALTGGKDVRFVGETQFAGFYKAIINDDVRVLRSSLSRNVGRIGASQREVLRMVTSEEGLTCNGRSLIEFSVERHADAVHDYLMSRS